MKNNFYKRILSGLIITIIAIIWAIPVHAQSYLSLSPLTQKLVLDPGDTYEGSFHISNQEASDENLTYSLEVIPFHVNDEGQVFFDEEATSWNQIVDWISIDNQINTIEPGETATVHFRIVVPEDAPAGGQYAAIRANGINDINDSSESEAASASISVAYGVAYLIMTEITGDTVVRGEIIDVELPSFLLDGNLVGKTSIKNTGNVHSSATYTLEIFPLFSDEELFTNAENPEQNNIMPGQTYYNETIWGNTPPLGIFNIVYTVEFAGVTKQVSKIVIKCPIWLLFIIIFAIIALIMYFFVRSKNRKNNKKRTQSAKAE